MTVNELQDELAALDAQLTPLLDWLAQQATWRKQLSDELVDLLAASPHIRNSTTLGRKLNLELSINAIDRGTRVFEGTGYELTNARLGELMRADGYHPVGADLSRNYSGVFQCWRGGEKELRPLVKELTRRKDVLEAKLAEATLSDAERAEREKENAAYRDALNSMRITGSDDGRYLVAKARDGRELELNELTPVQREALARANREYVTLDK